MMDSDGAKTWRGRFELAFGFYRKVRFWVVLGALLLHITFLVFGIGVSFFEERVINSYVRGFGTVGIVLGIISATRVRAPTNRQVNVSLAAGIVALTLFFLTAATSQSDVVQFWPALEIAREAMIKLGWISVLVASVLYGVGMLFIVRWLGFGFR